MFSLGKLEGDSPARGVGHSRLRLDPLRALPQGTHELLQSCEGRERSEGAPTFLLHHRRDAKPTRLVAQHPLGRSSPGSDVLSSIPVASPPFPLRAPSPGSSQPFLSHLRGHRPGPSPRGRPARRARGGDLLSG